MQLLDIAAAYSRNARIIHESEVSQTFCPGCWRLVNLRNDPTTSRYYYSGE